MMLCLLVIFGGFHKDGCFVVLSCIESPKYLHSVFADAVSTPVIYSQCKALEKPLSAVYNLH